MVRVGSARRRALLALGASLGLLACASSEEVDETFTPAGGSAGSAASGSTGGSGGSGGSGSTSSGGTGSTGAYGGTGATGASGGSGGTAGSVGGAAGFGGASGAGNFGGTGATGASGGSGGTGNVGGTGASGGTGGTTSCGTNINTCQTASYKGTMTGDQGPVTKTITDYGSTWLRVRVTEDNGSIIGEALQVKLELSAPLSADIDVYAYLNESTDSSPCALSPFGKSDSGGIGADESFTISWGDGIIGSGSPDSRDLLIEVVHKGGTCNPQDPWVLKLTGDP